MAALNGGRLNIAACSIGGAQFCLDRTLDYMRDPLGFLARVVREHGDVVRMRLGNLPTYLLVNPEHIEYVLRTHADNFIKDVLTRWLTPLVGQGLLTSEGTFWRRQRRLAQPSFQHQQIELAAMGFQQPRVAAEEQRPFQQRRVDP